MPASLSGIHPSGCAFAGLRRAVRFLLQLPGASGECVQNLLLAKVVEGVW